MKKIKVILCLAWLCVEASTAQSINPSHGIGRVDQDHEDSSEYLARTPYTLRWAADPKYKLYGKQDPTVKVESYLAGIHVYDVATGKMIVSASTSPLNGSMKVPVAGKHRIKVFCTGPVNLSFDEDKTALETASRRGELKDGATVEEAKAGSSRTKNEKIAAVKNELIGKLEAKRSEIGSNTVDMFRMHAERAAQLASSEEDFKKRFIALITPEMASMDATVLSSIRNALSQ